MAMCMKLCHCKKTKQKTNAKCFIKKETFSKVFYLFIFFCWLDFFSFGIYERKMMGDIPVVCTHMISCISPKKKNQFCLLIDQSAADMYEKFCLFAK